MTQPPGASLESGDNPSAPVDDLEFDFDKCYDKLIQESDIVNESPGSSQSNSSERWNTSAISGSLMGEFETYMSSPCQCKNEVTTPCYGGDATKECFHSLLHWRPNTSVVRHHQ